MDVVLRTNTTDPELSFRGLSRPDPSPYGSYGATLSVHSGGFSGERTFWFSDHKLGQFIAALVAMDEQLSGRARLVDDDQQQHVELEVDHWGGVRVSGTLLQHAPDQLLRFEFLTDQTCLRPLIEDLEECRHRLLSASQAT